MPPSFTHKNSGRNIALIFVGVLFVGLIIQTTFWFTFPVADQHYWVTDVKALAAGTDSPSDPTYVYPATTLKYPMAALVDYGVKPEVAVRIVMVIFIALGIALAALIAYRLWPQNLVWLSLALMLMPDLRLLHATPAAAAASILMIVFVLLFVYARETKEEKSPMPLVALGICAGILLATRIDTGTFVLITATPFLLYIFRLRAWIPLLVAPVIFAACNPHLWVHPIEYLSSIPRQILIQEALEGRKIFGEFLMTFPVAILSLCASIFLAQQYMRRKIRDMRFPFDVYLWFLGTTLLFTALLAPLSYHPIRYFMPFYLAWDILAPLWVGVLARSYLPSHSLPWLTERRVEWAVVGLIVLLVSVRLLVLIFADTREVIL